MNKDKRNANVATATMQINPRRCFLRLLGMIALMIVDAFFTVVLDEAAQRLRWSGSAALLNSTVVKDCSTELWEAGNSVIEFMTKQGCDVIDWSFLRFFFSSARSMHAFERFLAQVRFSHTFWFIRLLCCFEVRGGSQTLALPAAKSWLMPLPRREDENCHGASYYYLVVIWRDWIRHVLAGK